MLNSVLGAVVALVGWTIIMLVWAVAVRIPQFGKAGIDVNTMRGSRPGGLDGILPDSAQWKMHNYIHLTEQPVLFYAICGVLAITGSGAGLNAALPWTYVGLRVVHSLVQSIGNIIRFRFAVFALGTIVLIMLTVHAGLAVAGMHHL